MDYRLLIARRYLASRRRLTLISVISGISVAGVAVGVAALVVVLSVLNGFYDVVRDLLVSYDPHVRVEAVAGGGIGEADTLAALARLEPGVVSATPFVEGKALLATEAGGTLNQVVTVRGVDPSALDAEVERSITGGTFDLGRRAGETGIVMGAALAGRTGVRAAEPGVALDGGPPAGGSPGARSRCCRRRRWSGPSGSTRSGCRTSGRSRSGARSRWSRPTTRATCSSASARPSGCSRCQAA